MADKVSLKLWKVWVQCATQTFFLGLVRAKGGRWFCRVSTVHRGDISECTLLEGWKRVLNVSHIWLYAEDADRSINKDLADRNLPDLIRTFQTWPGSKKYPSLGHFT